MKRGIDISHHNGTIDWKKVDADFAYIKCNTGVNAKDPKINDNALGAHLAGKPFGYYHWVTLNKIDVVADAIAEAKDFITTLDALPKYSLIPALDIEEDNVLNISPGNIELWITTFVNELHAAGHRVMLYSYVPWLNANLPKDHKLGMLPLWVAQYNNRPAPVLPFGWKSYAVWQWSDKGTCPGVPGPVDLNRCEDLTPIMR